MNFYAQAKNTAANLVDKVMGEASVLDKTGEYGVAADPHVAGSRAAKDKDGDDGSYVGRTGSDVALDVEESGAEARSEQKRNAPS